MLRKKARNKVGKNGSNYQPVNRRSVTRLSKGFTLIELVIVMVIVAIGVALAVPTFEDIAQKRQTTSEAVQLAAFLGTAQSEAIKRNQEVRINLYYDNDTKWCVAAAIEAICNCVADPDDSPPPDLCTDDELLQAMNNMDFNKSSLESYVSYSTDTIENFAFDPIRGFMTDADLDDDLRARIFTVESENTDYRLQVEVSVVGRIRICNPVSTQAVPGYGDCT